MTPAQKAAIDRYFVDLNSVRDSFQLYLSEDKIRGALMLLSDTGELTREEYSKYDNHLLSEVRRIEEEKGF